jgi:zinc transporter ZupT
MPNAIVDEKDKMFPFANLFFGVGVLILFFVERGLESMLNYLRKGEKKGEKYSSRDINTISLNQESTGLVEESSPHTHSHVDFDTLQKGTWSQRLLKGTILCTSLVLHSFFEGLGLGSATGWRFIDLLIAILSHHLISALFLGVTLHAKDLHWGIFIFYLGMFSAAIPLGILMGILVSYWNSVEFIIIQGMCLAIASGVLLYVVCFEILNQFDPHKPWIMLSKMVFFLGGAILMVVVTIFLR